MEAGCLVASVKSLTSNSSSPRPSRRVPKIPSILWSENHIWDSLSLPTKWNLRLQKAALVLLFGIAGQLQKCPLGVSGHSHRAYGAVSGQLRTTAAQSLTLSSYGLCWAECPLLSMAAFPGAHFAFSWIPPALNSSERSICPWPIRKVSHHLKVPVSSYQLSRFLVDYWCLPISSSTLTSVPLPASYSHFHTHLILKSFSYPQG